MDLHAEKEAPSLRPHSFKRSWSHALVAPCRGLSPAREQGSLLAWDDAQWLYLLNRRGQRQAQRHFPGALGVACCSDDGSAFVAAGNRGEVWWLAPDLATRWERSLGQAILAVAVDSYGQYFALADAASHLHLYNRLGEAIWKISLPRPLHHLVFATTSPLLFGSSDFGLVACFDLKGQWAWRDGLVAHVGSIAVNGSGDHLVLACYSEGVVRYGAAGKKLDTLTPAEPSRLVALSFDGDLVLAAGQTTTLFLFDSKGQTVLTHPLELPATALAYGGLGDFAVVGQSNGTLIGLELARAP